MNKPNESKVDDTTKLSNDVRKYNTLERFNMRRTFEVHFPDTSLEATPQDNANRQQVSEMRDFIQPVASESVLKNHYRCSETMFTTATKC